MKPKLERRNLKLLPGRDDFHLARNLFIKMAVRNLGSIFPNQIPFEESDDPTAKNLSGIHA